MNIYEGAYVALVSMHEGMMWQPCPWDFVWCPTLSPLTLEEWKRHVRMNAAAHNVSSIMFLKATEVNINVRFFKDDAKRGLYAVDGYVVSTT